MSFRLGKAAATATLVTLASAVPAAMAFTVMEEPANALSLPTWAIHVSSVVSDVVHTLVYAWSRSSSWA
jgi:hypothetical protein